MTRTNRLSILLAATLAAATICPSLCGADAPTTAPVASRKFVLFDEDVLARAKQRAASDDPATKAALAKLRADADAILKKPAPSVTEKPSLPVGDDPHNYMSLAIYYWPNPDTKDGKPYINRDGVVNRKEVDSFDAPRKDRLVNSVRTLAMAHHLLGDAKYAEGAANYLRTWFLDPKTRMNPNLNHAQFVPGANDGRGYGIIETRSFVLLVDAVTLIDGSPAWTSSDRDGFKAWMNEFVDWLLTSKNGKQEAATTNNHGEWYDAQVCGLAAYLGRDDVVKKIAGENGPKRIKDQIQPDGSLPKEIARTRSLHYSLFAIEAWMQVAEVSRDVGGIDLYNYKSEDGRSLRGALDFLVPFLLGEQKWPHKTLEDERYTHYASMFRKAAKVYGDARYAAVAEKLGGENSLDALMGD